MQAVLRLGLTGGIGSGKSTVATLLAAAGVAVIDADAVSRQATASGGSAIDSIRHEFGDGFLTADGALDRDKMRQLVFTQPQARQRLEDIVHPLVGQACRQQAQAAVTAGHRCIVFDVPLLVETGHWRSQVDKVLVVDCTPQVQIERVMLRSNITRAAVEQIIASQASREARLQAADLVIFNAGLSIEELTRQVQQMMRHFGL